VVDKAYILYFFLIRLNPLPQVLNFEIISTFIYLFIFLFLKKLLVNY
jgi:hypothetical protein